MSFDFGGRTQYAGSVRTGIRWPLAEWLGAQGGLIFCLDRDYRELANELEQLQVTAQVIDLSSLLREPASNLSARIEQEDETEGRRKPAELAESSAVIRAGRSVQLFEDWWRGVDRSRLRTLFLTREPDVEAPSELIEEAVGALARLNVCGVCEARIPAEAATAGRMLNLKAVDPGRQMIKCQEERYLARDPLQRAPSRLTSLVALHIRRVH